MVFIILAHFSAMFQNPLATPPAAPLHIVILREPSVAEKVLEWASDRPTSVRKLMVESLPARHYRDHLLRQQARFIHKLPGQGLKGEIGPEVVDSRCFLLNMLLIQASQEEAEHLRSHQDVQGVYPNEERFLLMDTVPGVVAAPAFWTALGGLEKAGQGILIGFIDSGINQNHPMFNDDGLSAPPSFPLGNLAYTNQKVVVARSYVHPDFGLNPQENDTPEDEINHGSKVAAIAAGKPVDSPLGRIQGIAPMAFLGNYKVFGTPGVNSSTTSAAIIAAINDAAQDGMDVINLSLGGNARHPSTDPEQKVIARAAELGLVVVISAGNGGPNPGTIQSPGTSPAAITVGATTNGRIFGRGGELKISSTTTLPAELENVTYVPGTATQIVAPTGPFPMVSIIGQDQSEEACTPLEPDSLTGQVALVRRGSCFFSVKAENVGVAGATGMVVYNNIDGCVVVMQMGATPTLPGPAVMIEKSKGQMLRPLLESGAEVDVTFQAQKNPARIPCQAGVITDFSSRGPNIDQTIKPDLTAPGLNILTASNQVIPEPQYSPNSNGTSFSAPIVAGAAALLKQLHPDWSSNTIKSALVNTAQKTAANQQPPLVIRTGNGLLNLEQAMNVNAMLDPVSISFGILGEDASVPSNQEMKLTNVGSSTQIHQIELFELSDNPSLEMTISPLTISLLPGQTQELTLSAQSKGPLTAGAFEGYIQVRETQSESFLTSSYWGAVSIEDASVVLQVSQTPDSVYSEVSAALKAARPGNVVEITDSKTYRDVLNIRLNQEGLPLNGLTVRSKPGETPTLDATDLAFSSATVSVSNLDRVTIEGLWIRGGRGGISYQNASGVVRNNTVTNTRDTPGSHGINLSKSRVHIYGNTVQNNVGTGIRTLSSSALIQQNQVSENKGHGIFGSPGSVLGIFDNEIVRNGRPDADLQGIFVSDAVALVKGNSIRETTGNLPDGLLSRGSFAKLLIQDNLIEENQARGIALLEGAQASLVRNRIQANRDTGLYLAKNAQALVRASQFIENGKGIQVLSSQLELFDSLIVNSVDTTEGDGIVTDGEITIANATIFGNQGFGINLSDTTATVYNCIVFDNGQGDLSGTTIPFSDSNLIGSGQLDGNLTSDPFFSDPSAGDFSLQAASPAIDQGTHELPLSVLDLFSHQRSVDGDQDGVPQVDLGAIEFGSSYSQPLILPIPSLKAGEFVGLAVANAFAEPTRVLLQAYDLKGKRFGVFEKEVAAQTQFAILLRQAFGVLREGWVEILSTKPDLVSFTLLGDFSLTYLDGVTLAPAASSQILFPEVRNQGNEQTWLYIVNPHDQSLNLTLLWIRPDSSTVRQIRQLAAKGMPASSFGSIFGSGSGGYLTVTGGAGRKIYGMEIFGDSQSQGGLLAIDFEAAAPELFAAHLASTSTVETTLNLINSGPRTDVTVEAFSENGQMIQSLVLKDFPNGGQFRKKAREAFTFASESVRGWIRIRSTSGRLLGNISFGDPAGKFLAALPLQNTVAREFLLAHIAETPEIFTGLTFLNSSLIHALVSAEVFDKEGKSNGISFFDLAPRHKLARLLTELIPSLKTQRGGFIRVRSNVPLFGFELFGDRLLGFLSAVPQQAVVP